MYVVRLKKIKHIEERNDGIHIQSELYKTKVYFNVNRAMKQFEKWSSEMYEGKDYLTERAEISWKEWIQLLTNKKKEVLTSGAATVKSMENGVLFLDFK